MKSESIFASLTGISGKSFYSQGEITPLIDTMKAIETEEDKRARLLTETQTVSQAFNLGTATAVQEVIDELDREAAKKINAGFNEVAFTLGVLNCFVIVIIFCRYEQHLWLLYLCEAFFFIPIKFYHSIHAVPNEAFYYLDFCWIMNFLGVIALLILIISQNSLSESFVKSLFAGSFGVACGPLLGANMALPFVALIFHDVNALTGLFIHIYPPLLLYSLRWHGDDIANAWPGIFWLDYDLKFFPSAYVPFFQSILGSFTVLYFMWFIPYVIWQLLIGLKMPTNQGTYDTVFHSTMRDGACVSIGNFFWKRPQEISREQIRKNEFEMRDFCMYMIMHVIASYAALFVIAYPCHLSKYVHVPYIAICVALCTYRGARRYTYYSTKMYSNLIRKQFASELS